jgi:putative transposase
MNVARSALTYPSMMAAKDAPVLARMAELSSQYPRYGYRRIAIFLARDGHKMSFVRAHRLWRQARLQVPQKRPAADCGRASPAQATASGIARFAHRRKHRPQGRHGRTVRNHRTGAEPLRQPLL